MKKQPSPIQTKTADLSQALQQAVQLHQHGRLDQAEPLYRVVLTGQPNHFDATHLLGVLRFQQGRYAEAFDHIGAALKLNPDSASALLNFGAVLEKLGRPEEALASYDKALALKSDFAEAHNNRGNVLRDLKRSEEALTSYDKALGLKPDYVEALNNRGNALLDLRRAEAALASYDKAIGLKPDYVEAHYNRGNALLDLKRSEEALASYQKAIALKPDYPEAHNNMAGVLRDLGRSKEAHDHFEKAIALSTRNPLFYWSLANFKPFAAGDAHLAAMQDLAQNMGSLSIEEQIHLHFALGKAVDVKQHEQSFHHLLRGNALKRQQLTYDEAAMLGFFQRIQTVFTPELMRSKQGLGHPSTVPIFILGMPRSGTTLVEQILASHPKVFGAGELDDFERTVVRLGDRALVPFPELVRVMSDENLHQLGASYLDAIRAVAPEAARITDKMPSNFFFVGLIHLALPHARIIHTRRDPLDTCLSCFSQLFTAGQSYSYDLGELGRYYRGYQALMEHWSNVLPNGVMLEVQYEEVVDDLEGQARRLVAHCGLEWDDACLTFHETQRPVRTASVLQVRQPIYKSAVGRWRAYEAFLGPLTKALAGEPPSR